MKDPEVVQNFIELSKIERTNKQIFVQNIHIAIHMHALDEI